ncbi:hypothetical protein YB2330_000595 [Saitoella coloradoensis]
MVLAGIGSMYALVKVFNLIHASLALLRLRNPPGAPLPPTTTAVLGVFAKTLKSSVLITGGLSTFWGLADILSAFLPSHALPTSRFYILGFLAGLWGQYIDSRALALYLARTATESAWKIAVERGFVRGRKGGDVMLVAVGMGILGACYEANKGFEKEEGGKRGMEWLVRGLRGDAAEGGRSRRNSGHVVFDAGAEGTAGVAMVGEGAI